MTPNPPSQKIKDGDLKLIEAINSGNKELFPDLLERYEQKLYHFGLKLCRNVGDAEDLVQETFINVFKYLEGFRHETRFKNWLYRIATGVCAKMRRKSKYAPARELSLEEFMPGDHSAIEANIPQWASLPLEQVLNRELSGTIKDAVSKLPPKYRLVTVLRDMEGFSTSETAEILAISEANVKVRLHRARLFLREELKELYQGSRK